MEMGPKRPERKHRFGMFDVDRQIALHRRELRILKMALRGMTNDTAWRVIRACLNACFKEYIELVEQRAARDYLLWGGSEIERSVGQTELR